MLVVDALSSRPRAFLVGARAVAQLAGDRTRRQKMAAAMAYFGLRAVDCAAPGVGFAGLGSTLTAATDRLPAGPTKREAQAR